jgi:hypothetical protein
MTLKLAPFITDPIYVLGSKTQPTSPVGFDDRFVHSSHSRKSMTSMISPLQVVNYGAWDYAYTTDAAGEPYKSSDAVARQYPSELNENTITSPTI